MEKFGITNEIIMIKYNYNRGKIIGNDKTNGGVVGCASPDAKDISKVYIEDCFSIGENISLLPNQIAPNYATVVDSYYVSKTTNYSGYGKKYALYKFKYVIEDKDIVYLNLRNKKLTLWALDPDLNIILSWQNEGWQIIN